MYAQSGEPSSLDSARAGDVSSSVVIFDIYESLLKFKKRVEFSIVGGVEEYAFTKVISDKFLLLLPYRDCIVPFYESMTREHFVEQ
jgi:hypothetical protein